MNLTYRKASVSDAKMLTEIYNAVFYNDYIRYGECPAYGRTTEQMAQSILHFPKNIIINERKPVGVLSYHDCENGNYHIGCLCVIPAFQGHGIGTKAMRDFLAQHADWKSIYLITPADKPENISFYTKRCGFHITGKSMDGNVEVVNLCIER